MTKQKKRYGLSRKHTRKDARDFVDMDYIDKLSDAEKDFLDRFSREYYQNAGLKDPDALHATDEQRKKCYSANNARQRDMWNKFHRLPSDTSDAVAAEEDEDK